MSSMAVIYARQSLDRSGEAAAVNRQLEECRALAERQGLSVEREFVDNDKSATKGSRPQFQELLQGVKSGVIDTIICWHTDRLYRRVRDLVELVELAEKNRLKILTVKAGDLDLSTPSGRMLAGMLGSAARFEIEQKSARQVAANLQRARDGQRHFGNRPYGYERVDGGVQIVEAEAAVLREAINRFIAGESWYAMAKDFAARGVVSFNGRPFTYQNLRQRAINPANAGIRTYLGDVVTETGDWPAIVDKVTWERFETAIAARHQTQGWSKRIKYLGSGIYRCGKCGGRMKVQIDWAKGKENRKPIYMCENGDTRRLLAPVDAMVNATIMDRLSQPDAISLLTPREDVAALAAESQDLRARIDGLAALYADGVLSAVAVREQKAKLQARLEEAQSRIAATEGGSVLNSLISAPDIEKFWLEDVPIRAKRRVVDSLLTVTINPTKRGGNNAFRPEDVAIELRS